jgi:hypothetical protein
LFLTPSDFTRSSLNGSPPPILVAVLDVGKFTSGLLDGFLGSVLTGVVGVVGVGASGTDSVVLEAVTFPDAVYLVLLYLMLRS